MTDNPFAAPQTELAMPGVSQGLAVEGSLLVAPSGTVLPPRCVKTNQPITEQDYRTRTFTWCPPWVIGLILIGGLLVLVGYFVFRKKCRLTFGLHPDQRKKYRRRIWIKLGVALVLLCAMPIAGAYKSEVPVLIAFVFFIVAVVAVFVGNSPISVRKYKKGYFWIKGCSPEFLADVLQTPGAQPG